MREAVLRVLTAVSQGIWSLPFLLLLLGSGVYFTYLLRGIQVRYFKTAWRLLLSPTGEGRKIEPKKKRGNSVTGFGALCTELAASIGTGNMVGVAAAIAVGGPGALFWMWVAAFFGMATKYAECTLGVKYRQRGQDGQYRGGPFYYIERGMGRSFRWLGKLFAAAGLGAGLLGIGTAAQTHSAAAAVQEFFDPEAQQVLQLFGREYSVSAAIAAVLLTVAAGLVIVGGIRRISSAAQVIIPAVAALYSILSLMVLLLQLDQIPAALLLILQDAFGLRAAAGGMLGGLFAVMQAGIARGIFSNEAGLGSSPIAAAAAETEEPAEQGLISMLGPFIDTIVICTMTGLVILLTDTWTMGLQGTVITTRAFQLGLPFPHAFASFCMMLCLVIFAFTTILGWNYYSEQCLLYLTGGGEELRRRFRILYLLCVLSGPFLSISAVWTLADLFNGMMLLPNLVALLALSGVVKKETAEYFEKIHLT